MYVQTSIKSDKNHRTRIAGQNQGYPDKITGQGSPDKNHRTRITGLPIQTVILFKALCHFMSLYGTMMYRAGLIFRVQMYRYCFYFSKDNNKKNKKFNCFVVCKVTFSAKPVFSNYLKHRAWCCPMTNISSQLFIVQIRNSELQSANP